MTPAREPAAFSAQRLSGLPLGEVRAYLKSYLAQRPQRRWSLAPLPASVWAGHECVGLFGPKAGWDEPAAWPEIPAGVKTCFASTDGADMIFRACPQERLVLNERLNVLQAPADAPIKQPTLLLVPALLADRQGNRIGRGGGYYDRYLARHPEIRTIAVLHSDYVCDRFPAEWIHSGDARVTGLLTETAYQEMKS
jgi:hypothetical protein